MNKTMKYINKDDLISYIQQRLLDESLQLDDTILDNIEANTIDLVTAHIGARYDTSKVFADPPLRNGVLVQIISMITVYRVVRRNAARKVPEDYTNLYTDAIRMLEKIGAGTQYLENIPPITAADGSTGKLMYGNNTNTDYFI